MDDDLHYGFDRDSLTPEQRAAYDATYVGAIDRLHRALTDLKQAIIDALPSWLRRVLYGR